VRVATSEMASGPSVVAALGGPLEARPGAVAGAASLSLAGAASLSLAGSLAFPGHRAASLPPLRILQFPEGQREGCLWCNASLGGGTVQMVPSWEHTGQSSRDKAKRKKRAITACPLCYSPCACPFCYSPCACPLSSASCSPRAAGGWSEISGVAEAESVSSKEQEDPGVGERGSPGASQGMAGPPVGSSLRDAAASAPESFAALWEGRGGGREATWRPKGVLLAHVEEHTGAVNSLAVSLWDEVLLSAAGDGALKLWDCSGVERARCSGPL